MIKYQYALLMLLCGFCSTTLQAESLEGDAKRGEKVFWQCRTCHYPEKVVGHNNGPSLWNIFQKKAGKQPGFEYSEAMKKVSFVWTPQLMDVWLQAPAKFMPGNMMMSPGIENPQQRADLIEYLKQFSE